MNSTGPGKCQLEDCFFPSTSCGAGFMDAVRCPHWEGEHREDPTDVSADDERFPWTGRPFGLKDLRFVSAVRRPHVVGFIGLADAGKTTLLGMLFLMVYRGHRVLDDATFAGSFTLQGWENIARHLQLNSHGPIQFPSHTTQSGRFPGLLHLKYELDNGAAQDVLLSDAPGEWFSHWTEDADAESAAGARWLAFHADKVLIFADSAALTSPTKGAARTRLEFLIRRAQNNVNQEAAALVWSKTDLSRPDELVSTVNAHFHSCFPRAPVFSVQVPDKDAESNETTLQALKELFQWALVKRHSKLSIDWPEPEDSDPFLSYRGGR